MKKSTKNTKKYIYKIPAVCKHCNRDFLVWKNNVATGFGKYCSKKCSNRGNELGFKKGHKSLHTLEGNKKIGTYWRGRKRKLVSMATRKKMSISAKKYYDKIGRKTCKYRRYNGCYKCVQWRNKIFKRDNWTCQMCLKRGVYIEADHIKSWKNYPKLRHILSNGRTLCKLCHAMTLNYKGKNKNNKHL